MSSNLRDLAPSPMHAPDLAQRFYDAAIIAPRDEPDWDPNNDKRFAALFPVTMGTRKDAKVFQTSESKLAPILSWFADHKEGQKDGCCLIPGELYGEQRSSTAMVRNSILILDVDCGVPESEMREKLNDFGRLNVLSSTHSHGATTTDVAEKAVLDFLKSNGRSGSIVDVATLKDFFRYQGKFEHHIADSVVEVQRIRRKATGMVYEATHAPISKWRVVFPLIEDFEFAEVAPDQATAIEMWKRFVQAVADDIGLKIDRACTDPARLYFTARHAKGAGFYAHLQGGDTLSWRDYEGAMAAPEPAQKLPKLIRAPENKIAVKNASSGSKCVTEGGRGLADWSRRNASRFQFAAAIEAHAPDMIVKRPRNGLSGQCPFAENHSNPNDPYDDAFLMINAGEGKGPTFVAKCLHSSCQNYRGPDFVAKLIQDGTLEASVIEDEEFMVGEPRGAEVDTDFFKPSAMFEKTFYAPIDGRLWLHKRGDDETSKPVCSAFRITNSVRYADKGEKGFYVEVLDEYGNFVLVELSRDEVIRNSGKEAVAKLANAGMSFFKSGDADVVNYLKADSRTGVVMFSKAGFRDLDGRTVFILPTGGAVLTDEEECGLALVARCKDTRTPGTLDGWIRGSTQLFNLGDVGRHAQLGTLMGFVGPILDLTKGQTACFSLEADTSRTKTTALKLGVSVWTTTAMGQGNLTSLMATTNFLETPLERASGTFAGCDEATLMSGLGLKNLAYVIDSGVGKGRSTPSGAEQRQKSWTTAVAVTSEAGLVQRMHDEKVTVSGGLAARITTLDFNDGGGIADADMGFAAQMFANPGHAGPAFIRGLAEKGYVTDPQALRKAVEAASKALTGDRATVLITRLSQGLAALWVAGDVCREAGLIPSGFDVEQLVKRFWVGVGESELAPADPTVKAREALTENITARLGIDIVRLNEPRAQQVAIGHIRHRFAGEKDEKGGHVVVISAGKLSELAGKGANDRGLRKALGAEGVLIPRPRSNKREWGWNYFEGIGRGNWLVLDCAVLGLEENRYDRKKAEEDDGDSITIEENHLGPTLH